MSMPQNGRAREGRDNYGFVLECSQDQLLLKGRCDRKQAQQLSAWEKYWNRKELPRPEKLKKLCRKACIAPSVKIHKHVCPWRRSTLRRYLKAF